MKAKAFVPGHISCVFRPVRTDDVLTTGSLGFGIRLDLGCTATVWERSDDNINICINGKRCEAEITRAAIESMAPGCGLEIRLKHDLPMEQGFGTSASGTFAAALCTSELLGIDRNEAVKATHRMECSMGGGLGDLLAIDSDSAVPVREVPGAPGLAGRTSDSGLDPGRLSLVVFEESLRTGSVLSDKGMMERIAREGDVSMDMFRKDMTLEGMFNAANHFSERIGLESEAIREGLRVIREQGHKAGMCMLGNSLYSTAPSDILEDHFPYARVFSCGTYSGRIAVSRL